MKFNNDELINISNEFLKKYNLNLNIPIIINNRLRISMGKYYFSIDNKPLRIELSKLLMEYASEEIIIDTLKHELIHYALGIKNIPNDDNDIEFINECKKFKVGLTEEIEFGKYYYLKCDKCNSHMETYIKKHINKKYMNKIYKSRCCDSNYSYIKTIVKCGDEIIDFKGES